MLPTIRNKPAKQPNWHGVDGRFTQHYFSKFYQDNSLEKAARKTQMGTSYQEKETFYNQEIEKIVKNRYVLLNINTEKEKFEKIKRKVMKEKRLLENRLKNAAISIQKHIRGYLCRLHHDYEMEELKKVKLIISVKSMKRHVGECCIYLADNIVPATIVIQKYMRRYLAIKVLKNLKKEYAAALKITRFMRVVKNRAKFRKCVERLIIQKKLKEIKKRLRWLRVKIWWKQHRHNFTVIRLKMRSRNTVVIQRTPNRSRKGSIDTHKKSRKASMLSEGLQVVNLEEESGKIEKKPSKILEDTQGNFAKIDEAMIEDSLSLSLNPNDFNKIQENRFLSEDEQFSPERLDEDLEENQSFFQDMSSSDLDSSQTSNISEIQIDEIPIENIEEKPSPDDKNKPAANVEEQEKPIPSYRKPTVASNQWKKKPQTPPEPPKEIFPPPKHLLIWTKCRKIYKNLTKKYRKKIPLWKPPLSANYTKPRKLPKLVVRPFKIPDFLEPYIPFSPVEAQDLSTNINQDEDKDNYSVDSDTSYEYESADFRSNGLNLALPQLYSIVKSYGKNADMIVNSLRKNKNIE